MKTEDIDGEILSEIINRSNTFDFKRGVLLSDLFKNSYSFLYVIMEHKGIDKIQFSFIPCKETKYQVYYLPIENYIAFCDSKKFELL